MREVRAYFVACGDVERNAKGLRFVGDERDNFAKRTRCDGAVGL